ncbi:hypothetical protein [Halococcus sediminicola]|uniref:hypothetical protein n=1 Tax=Halococcus sediminicola TaxID=1264579 RepID=UPI0012AB6156|nr:hypothetical protein [Halococcus sediminicola]
MSERPVKDGPHATARLYADEKQTLDMYTKLANSPALVCIFTAEPLSFVSTRRETSVACLPSA